MQGTASGAIATILGTMVGWVDAKSLIEASVLATVGAVVGFAVNLICKWAFEKLRKRFFPKSA